jgi:hypothetical protein
LKQLDQLDWRQLRALLRQARDELARREAARPMDEETAFKALAVELRRHHRRKEEDRFDPFA